MNTTTNASAQTPDQLLVDIAEYVAEATIDSDLAYETARACLMDTLGCGLLALNYPACTKLLGPVVPGAEMPGGARVPGTNYEFDPVGAAFAIGCAGRWHDFNDSWFGVGGGHPSDMFGALLATGDHLSRRGEKVSMATILDLAIKAYEILGLHLMQNAFKQFDYTGPLKAATTAVTCRMLGGDRGRIVDALSQGWIDGQPLRIFRAPFTGPRKNWASPDAAARGLGDGDVADVASKTATVRVPVKLESDLQPGTVALPHGWGHQHAAGLSVASKTSGVNVNLLAADGPRELERFSGMAHLTGILVQVTPATELQDAASWSGIAAP